MSSNVRSPQFALFPFMAVLASPSSSAYADDFVPFKVKYEASFGPPQVVPVQPIVLVD